MKLTLLICLAGALGTFLRYETNNLINRLLLPSYYSTISVNLLGSFIIGLITFIGTNYITNQDTKQIITIGILGSFTTFSGFSLDVYKLIESNQVILAGIYIIGSITISLALFYFGVYTAKSFA